MLDNPFSEAVVESDEVSPQPPFLQAEQPQVPQPLPISLVLQTLPQLRCPSLDTLQPLNVSLGVRGPNLNTAFEVRPHQCPVQGHDHCPSPAGHTIADTSQDAIGFLGHLGTLLAHIQAAVDQHPHVLFRRAAFQPLFPKPVALHGVVVTQVQDPALGLVEPHTIDLGPSIQLVQVPLQSLPTLKQINTPTQLGVICKLTEGALNPLIQITDRDIKQNWPQHRALGNTTCDRPPTGFNSIHHDVLRCPAAHGATLSCFTFRVLAALLSACPHQVVTRCSFTSCWCLCVLAWGQTESFKREPLRDATPQGLLVSPSMPAPQGRAVLTTTPSLGPLQERDRISTGSTLAVCHRAPCCRSLAAVLRGVGLKAEDAGACMVHVVKSFQVLARWINTESCITAER
ncbi:hypothetical protein QYF61_017663 [Mycteria americana]|uniref:Uncharacterized protein n=1 Tax=Mycteria americana TaxID=33587 RepID=A0AAN7NG62_MYCAM|nr:hypothetical protein QYF61_017663 [Mycteria americana]